MWPKSGGKNIGFRLPSSPYWNFCKSDREKRIRRGNAKWWKIIVGSEKEVKEEFYVVVWTLSSAYVIPNECIFALDSVVIRELKLHFRIWWKNGNFRNDTPMDE